MTQPGAAQVESSFDLEAAPFEGRGHDFTEQNGFREVLRSHHHPRCRGTDVDQGESPGKRSDDEGGDCAKGPRSLREPSKSEVDHHRQQGRGQGASQDEIGVDRGDAAEDVGAKTSRTHRRRDGRGSDRPDRGESNTAENHGQGEREFDKAEAVERRESQGKSGFAQGRVDAADSVVGVAKNGQHRVNDEGQDRGPWPDAADEGKRDEQTEQGQARDGLNHICDREHRAREGFLSGEQDPERQPDQRGHERRETRHRQMLRDQASEFGSSFAQEEQEVDHSGRLAATKEATYPGAGARSKSPGAARWARRPWSRTAISSATRQASKRS